MQTASTPGSATVTLPREPSGVSLSSIPNQSEQDAVTLTDVRELLEMFSRAELPEIFETGAHDKHQRKVEELIARDYEYEIIDNGANDLCTSYPRRILFMTGTKGEQTRKQAEEVTQLAKEAKYARCRCRGVMPVLRVNDRNVCRSATLSNEKEMNLNSAQAAFKRFWIGLNNKLGDGPNSPPISTSDAKESSDVGFEQPLSGSVSWPAGVNVQAQRAADINLLKHLRIGTIVDLMVEHCKVKYGMTVCSSEKADSLKRYHEAGFDILAMPYPGVEAFAQFSSMTSALMFQGEFDWSNPEIDVELNLTDEQALADEVSMDWEQYRKWSIVRLTVNYTLLLHKLLMRPPKQGEEDNIEHGHGILIHCISGWDRTPLFVSLLRMLLWAEGKVHKSLTAIELLYLTLAYDWFLFGHLFKDRRSRGEDILKFCFHVMPALATIMRSRNASVSEEPKEDLAVSFKTIIGEAVEGPEHFSLNEENDDPLEDIDPAGPGTDIISLDMGMSSLSLAVEVEEEVNDAGNDQTFTRSEAIPISSQPLPRHLATSVSTARSTSASVHSYQRSETSSGAHGSLQHGSWQMVGEDNMLNRMQQSRRDAESQSIQKLQQLQTLFVNSWARSVGSGAGYSEGFWGWMSQYNPQ
eukprot:Clim_evm46s232 gene=Clim_evmTU46s232